MERIYEKDEELLFEQKRSPRTGQKVTIIKKLDMAITDVYYSVQFSDGHKMPVSSTNLSPIPISTT